MSNETSNDRNKTTSITIIMRRHSLDPGSIGRHIKSIFTSPSRKLRSFTNHNNDNSATSNRPSRRFSVPDKKYSDKLDNNADLHTIDEVSKSICVYRYVYCCLL